MDDLNSDWREFLRLLIAHRVRFVVVGGHAVAAHGRPRLTGDLDVLVASTEGNARRLLAALHDFGFGGMGLSLDRFTKPGRVTMLGRVPYRIDILTGIDGVTFEDAWAGRIRSRLGGKLIPFLGRTELLRNKLSSGRPKDLADIALLREGPAPRLRPQRKAKRARKRRE